MDLMSFINNIATPLLAVMGLTIGLFQVYRGQKEKIRAQAEQISAWWARVDDDRCDEKEENDSRNSGNKFGQPPREDKPQYHAGIILLNQSQTPIRNLAVYGEAYEMEEGRRKDERVKTLLLQPILVPGSSSHLLLPVTGKPVFALGRIPRNCL